MRILYQATAHSQKPMDVAGVEEPFVLLTRDKWNDWGFQTSFDLFLRRQGQYVYLGTTKIAVNDTSESATKIVGPDIAPATQEFHIDSLFVSLGTSLDFYRQLREHLPADLHNILEQLHDVPFLEYRQPHFPALILRKEKVFQESLLRDTGALAAYGDAKTIIFEEELHPKRFDFEVRTKLRGQEDPVVTAIRFEQSPAVPTKIFVLIGRNGLGKTQTLYTIQRGLLDATHEQEIGYTHPNVRDIVRPPFRTVIAVAYSPFERFPVISQANERNRIDYAYCGFRNEAGTIDVNAALGTIGSSLIAIIRHDIEQSRMRVGRTRPKFSSLARALSDALGLKGIKLVTDSGAYDVAVLMDVNPDALLARLDMGLSPEHVLFFDRTINELSAGQRMFVLTAFNVVANIQPDSLLLVDEPELYLHPNLECAFIRMLRALLDLFESYAVIATHSVFVARETPARNIAIFREADPDGVIATHSVIETFGGDLNSIADYIFDNVTQSRPFEEWLDSLVAHGMTLEELRRRHGAALNMESMLYLRQKLETRPNG